jgi:hypothetical protein
MPELSDTQFFETVVIEIERQIARVKARRLQAATPGEDPLAVAGLLEGRLAAAARCARWVASIDCKSKRARA